MTPAIDDAKTSAGRPIVARDFAVRGVILALLGGGALAAAFGAGPQGAVGVLVVAAAFAILPAEAGWWAWVASTLTQGVAAPGLGLSLNILGAAAFWGGLAGLMLRRYDSAERLRLPSGGFTFLLLGVSAYFALAALQGWPRGSGVAVDSLRHLLVNLATGVTGVALFAGRGRAGRLDLARGFVFLTGFIALVGLAEYIVRRDLLVGGVDTAGGLFRINGIAPNPIVYGLHLVWGLPWAFYLACSARRAAERFGAAGVLAVASAAGFLTLNRQTMVLAAVVGIVALLTMRGRMIPWVLAAGLLLGVASAPILGPKIVERFALLGDLHYDTSFKYRRDNFRVAREMVRASPLTGIGLGQYPHNWREFMPDNLFYMQYDDPDRQFYTDLGYVQLAAESGWLGLGLFLVLLLGAAGAILPHYTRACGRVRSRLEPGARPSRREAVFEPANWYAALMLLILLAALATLIQDTFLRPQLWIGWALVASWGGRALDRGIGTAETPKETG